jgi:uncharacterized membrane protein YczE
MLTVPPKTELRRRLPRLLPGLACVGVGLAAMVRSGLGLGPWEVLHQGLSRRTGIPIGSTGILVGFLVLLAWIPLRQRLGVGTISNVVLVGLTIDATLLILPDLDETAARWAALLVGVVLIGTGSGLYIGAGLGAGPRDGVMTALAERGHSLRLVRTLMEVSVLLVGWLLGGTVGIGTVVFALAIGPLVQLFLGRLSLTAPAE